MTYRPWAKEARKEWLPKEGPFIILRDIPPGKPALLKPDLKKCPSVKTMKDSVEKLKIRMSASEREWWENRIRKEEEKVREWDSLTEEDYGIAGESFDLLEFKYSMPEPEPDDDDEAEYKERNEKLLHLIEKKENHKPVKIVKQVKKRTVQVPKTNEPVAKGVRQQAMKKQNQQPKEKRMNKKMGVLKDDNHV